MKGLFECLTDELRIEIARQYRESIGSLDDLPEEEGTAALMILVAILPKGVERFNAAADDLKQKKEQAVEEKPKKRRGGKRKTKSDAEVDQIAGDLLAGLDI